jgi:hypothetical protein
MEQFMASGINISEKTLSDWSAKKAVLEREIEEKQRDLVLLSKSLEAASFLSSQVAPNLAQVTLNGHEPTVVGSAKPVSAANGSAKIEVHGANMTDAIIKIANGSPVPLAKKDLRKKLRDLGFKPNQLGAYLYTAVGRLQKRNLIGSAADGKVWKAPA